MARETVPQVCPHVREHFLVGKNLLGDFFDQMLNVFKTHRLRLPCLCNVEVLHHRCEQVVIVAGSCLCLDFIPIHFVLDCDPTSLAENGKSVSVSSDDFERGLFRVFHSTPLGLLGLRPFHKDFSDHRFMLRFQLSMKEIIFWLPTGFAEWTVYSGGFSLPSQTVSTSFRRKTIVVSSPPRSWSKLIKHGIPFALMCSMPSLDDRTTIQSPSGGSRMSSMNKRYNLIFPSLGDQS